MSARKQLVEKYYVSMPGKFSFSFLSCLFRACKNCTTELEDCFSAQCVTGHGIERTVLTFNRMIPGPSIQASGFLFAGNTILFIECGEVIGSTAVGLLWRSYHCRCFQSNEWT